MGPHRKAAAVYKVRGNSEIHRLLSRNTSTSERQVSTITVSDQINTQHGMHPRMSWVAKMQKELAHECDKGGGIVGVLLAQARERIRSANIGEKSYGCTYNISGSVHAVSKIPLSVGASGNYLSQASQ